MPQTLPKDPVILLSFVNTELRDHYTSLDKFCHAHGADRAALEQKLGDIDYCYDAATNQFIQSDGGSAIFTNTKNHRVRRWFL